MIAFHKRELMVILLFTMQEGSMELHYLPRFVSETTVNGITLSGVIDFFTKKSPRHLKRSVGAMIFYSDMLEVIIFTQGCCVDMLDCGEYPKQNQFGCTAS